MLVHFVMYCCKTVLQFVMLVDCPRQCLANYTTYDRGVYDEYAGLMTQREKDWLIRLQLMQLSTDSPYVDDYYYTVTVLCLFLILA